MHGTRWFPVRRASSPLASSLLASSLLASCLLLLCALSVVTADRGEGGGAGGRRPPAAGSIALEGGAVDGTGHVLVWHDGRWGTVCDDGWGRNAADVVCRTLGYRSALSHSVGSHFGTSTHDFWLDNVRCAGDEVSLLDCQTGAWGEHDCDERELAGVFCDISPHALPAPVPVAPPAAHKQSDGLVVDRQEAPAAVIADVKQSDRVFVDRQGLPQNDDVMSNSDTSVEERPTPIKQYRIRIVSGRNPNEGRVEIKFRGQKKWGTICSDNWSLFEAMVACRQAGKGFASSAVPLSFFGGEGRNKLVAGVRCMGSERRLWRCLHAQTGHVTCPKRELVAGVICTDSLPDLEPNATMVEKSAYLQDVQMYYLQCAMEENCAALSAYRVRDTSADWHITSRRLLRFSSSTWNVGTADFRPDTTKQQWEWHMCHMHYHSMQVFAHYDLLDVHGNRVAEGHKASFCLEDVQCRSGVQKQFICKGFGDQGISVGCADDYLHDIDCQWIDITDVSIGTYVFKMHINPEYKIAELNYDNNAVVCDVVYNGVAVTFRNCHLERG